MSAFSLYSWSAAGEAAALVRNHCINVHRSFFFVIWEREEKTLQNTEPLKKKKKETDNSIMMDNTYTIK